MEFPIRSSNNKAEKIGRMRHRVYFLTPTVSRDGAGGEDITWATGSDVWANVNRRPVGSDDQVIADRITNVTYAQATLRYDSAISPKNKLVFESAEWEILSVLADQLNNYMTLELAQYKPE